MIMKERCSVLRFFIAVVAAITMLAASTTLLAQGVTQNVKTPPLAASNTFFLPVDIHPGPGMQPPWAGWAGARMSVHILDASEMDIISITPVAAGPLTRGPTGAGIPTGPTIVDPFGPASGNLQSVVQFYTAWGPVPPLSGINVTPSVNLPIFDVPVHVKNSTGQNSDVDATFGIWNIWHIRDNPGSTIVQLSQSDYILVRSSINDIQQLHTPGSQFVFPTNPANPETGHWLHILDPVPFHLVGSPGSQYYATFLNAATLGIDHIPEPTSVVLLGAGTLCMVVGSVFRRRRRKLAA